MVLTGLAACAVALRFKLFTHMDDDRSGKLTYKEFSGLCREELKLKKADMPDLQLQGAWNALDDDDSGFITAGEFVRRRTLPRVLPLDPRLAPTHVLSLCPAWSDRAPVLWLTLSSVLCRAHS